MTKLDEIIKDQDKFLLEQVLVTLMLRTYQNNTDEFYLLFSKEIREYYQFDFTNPEYVWESLSELCNDFTNNEKQFCFHSCGIFETLYFAKPKKKKLKYQELQEFFYDTAYREWGI
jgi:hypothetical protein